MQSYTLITISVCIYAVSFFITTFTIPRSSFFIKVKQLEIIPIVAIVTLLTQRIFISHISAFRLVMAIYLGFTFIYHLITLKYPKANPLLVALFGIIFFFLAIRLKSTAIISSINIFNILCMGALFSDGIRRYKKSPTKLAKELLEVKVIGFIGIILLSLASSYYLISTAIGIIILYQVADIIIITKHDINERSTLTQRLQELEYRFDRSVEFEAKKRTSVMADKVEHIREKSQRDPMTKALNRHGLTSEINNLIRDTSVKIFSIALFDIDYFKSINDTKGHIVGDECLKFLSYTFMVNNRKIDMLGRYGGDEFILILPHVNAPVALEICDRMRSIIQTKSVPAFTISTGISTYPYDGRAFTSLLEVADKGLYKAKENGRNRVAYEGNVFIKS